MFINAVCSGFDHFVRGTSYGDKTDVTQQFIARKFLNEKKTEWLQQELERIDPEYYAEVDKKNPVRLIRALEVIYTTGKKYSEQRIGKKAERPFQSIKIGLNLPREILNEQINKRVDEMIENGLLNEARQLYLHRKLNALQTVGLPGTVRLH